MKKTKRYTDDAGNEKDLGCELQKRKDSVYLCLVEFINLYTYSCLNLFLYLLFYSFIYSFDCDNTLS